MSTPEKNSTAWSRIQALAMKIRKNGLKEVTGVLSFSLFFIMGLATLGACIFAGVAAVIVARWQQYKAQDNTVAEPEDSRKSDNPIVAA